MRCYHAAYRQRAINLPIRDFHLPRYQEIPDVGLFLDQTTKYLTRALQPLCGISITSSMISNYVKQKLISRPEKRQYSRDQIAALMFIAIAKNVLSMEHISMLFRLQQQQYDTKTAYEYFCQEFENVLFFIFGLKDQLEEVGKDHTDEKTMLRNTIITVAHKVYLDKYLATLHDQI